MKKKKNRGKNEQILCNKTRVFTKRGRRVFTQRESFIFLISGNNAHHQPSLSSTSAAPAPSPSAHLLHLRQDNEHAAAISLSLPSSAAGFTALSLSKTSCTVGSLTPLASSPYQQLLLPSTRSSTRRFSSPSPAPAKEQQ